MTINDSRPESTSIESILGSVPASAASDQASQSGSTIVEPSSVGYHNSVNNDDDDDDDDEDHLENNHRQTKNNEDDERLAKDLSSIKAHNYHPNRIGEKDEWTSQAPLAPPQQTEKVPATSSTELDYAITPRSIRIAILAATLLENLFFSGIIFGWPALFYMLKSENIYLSLCEIIAKVPLPPPAVPPSPLPAVPSVYDNSTTFTNLTTGVTIGEEGFHHKLSHGLDCSRQENILNMAYTIGIFSMGFTSFAWGFMLESYGLRFVRLALNFLISFGCALLCFTTEEHSHLIIPAIIILGLIGVPLRIANMQIADLFPRKRSTVITIFSGAFSASPVVFVMLKYGYDQWNLSYFTVMLSLFFLSLLMLPITFCLLPKHSVRNRESKLLTRWDQYRQLTIADSPCLNNNNKPQFIGKQKLFAFIEKNKNQTNGTAGTNDATNGTKKSGSMLDLFLNNKLVNGNGNGTHKKMMMIHKDADDCNSQELQCLNLNFDNENNDEECNGTNGNAKNKKKPEIVSSKKSPQMAPLPKTSNSFWQMFRGKVTKDDIPLSVSLVSLSFLAHQLWFSWLNTYMVLYSGSLALWLARVTDNVETTRNFTQAFGLVQVSALLFAPIAGYIMDRSVRRASQEPDQMKRKLRQAQSGFIPILITTITLSCAVLCRFFNTAFAVYISIVFITLLRSFLIAVASAYIRVRFPASHFNRLNGIMCTTGAFFSLLQFPLFYFESLSNQYAFYVNVFCAVMTLLSMLNPLCLGITALQLNLLQKEHRHNERLQARKGAFA